MNVDENSLAHNPNGRVSQRIARGLNEEVPSQLPAQGGNLPLMKNYLRHVISTVMVQYYVHDVGR